MNVVRLLFVILSGLFLGVASILIFQRITTAENSSLVVPFLTPSPTPKPLLAYTIPALQTRTNIPRTITVESLLSETDEYASYIVSFQPLGKRMTALLNVPKPIPATASAIIMIRGYAPPENYVSGTGTKNSSRALAQARFITIAPDFFGFGGSDAEPTDSWQARFEKPIVIAELYAGLQQFSLKIPTASTSATESETTDVSIASVGLWGHSNGGQIALTTLEMLQQPIPTVLWAPVTAPFPYSILFFSDENEDEGKEMRKWVSLFEENYDVFDFSLTQHIASLRGPLQIHHGTADEAALKTWSDEFLNRIEVENVVREQQLASDSTALSPIEVEYFSYPGADHNLTPGWDMAISRTISFFRKTL